jgi:hypothetical protein
VVVVTRTVTVAGHDYARDRAPYDDPMRRDLWRRRWNCGCGEVGDWSLRSEAQTHADWLRHVQRRAEEEGRAS